MERPLTVLLPVHDAEGTLHSTVIQVLEMASDLTTRLDLLIIDDGSADTTPEVAEELMRSFPQVRMIRHRRPLGREAAVNTGLTQSRGEVLVVRDGPRPLLERLHPASRPARPNYLGRSRQYSADNPK